MRVLIALALCVSSKAFLCSTRQRDVRAVAIRADDAGATATAPVVAADEAETAAYGTDGPEAAVDGAADGAASASAAPDGFDETKVLKIDESPLMAYITRAWSKLDGSDARAGADLLPPLFETSPHRRVVVAASPARLRRRVAVASPPRYCRGVAARLRRRVAVASPPRRRRPASSSPRRLRRDIGTSQVVAVEEMLRDAATKRSIDSADELGASALTLAASGQTPKPDIVRVLLAAGADPYVRREDSPGAGRGAAAAATWTFLGAWRRRSRDVELPARPARAIFFSQQRKARAALVRQGLVGALPRGRGRVAGVRGAARRGRRAARVRGRPAGDSSRGARVASAPNAGGASHRRRGPRRAGADLDYMNDFKTFTAPCKMTALQRAKDIGAKKIVKYRRPGREVKRAAATRIVRGDESRPRRSAETSIAPQVPRRKGRDGREDDEAARRLRRASKSRVSAPALRGLRPLGAVHGTGWIKKKMPWCGGRRGRSTSGRRRKGDLHVEQHTVWHVLSGKQGGCLAGSLRGSRRISTIGAGGADRS